MVPRKHPVRRFRVDAAVVALMTVSASVLTTFDGPSAAASPVVGAGAIGQSVDVTIPGGPPVSSGPLPTVTLPPDGRGVSGDVPSATAHSAHASAPFRGAFLDTGALSVASTGPAGWPTSNSSSSAADVHVLGGALTFTRLRSTCTSFMSGPASGSATVSGGSLALSGTERITLPDIPPPNSPFAGTDPASGATFRVILNEQKVEGGSITVTAAHVILDGPSAVGHIILGQSWCGAAAGAPAPSPATPSTPGATPPPARASSEAPAADVGAKATSVAAPKAGAAVVTQAASTSVTGSACGYFVNVGLFGGPQELRGCRQNPKLPSAKLSESPFVELPSGGSPDPIAATKPEGAKGNYGPATIFGGRWPCEKVGQDDDGDGITGNCTASAPPSGPLSASVQGTLDGTVTATAAITRSDAPIPQKCYKDWGPNPPSTDGCASYGGLGPFPVEADSVHVECTASATETKGSVTFKNGVHATSTDLEGNPLEQEPVPDKPPANYTRSGVITNVGDVFTAVYNEQIVNPDGSLTVNGVHMYLFGPTAVGEMVKGQATCGKTPSSLSGADKIPPICGTPVVKPVSPEIQEPMKPLSHLIGMFDAGGIKEVTNIKETNGKLQVGVPDGLPYLQLVPGQKGPLQITVIRSDEAEAQNLPLSYSFDVTDMTGNKTAVSVTGVPPAAVCTGTLTDGTQVPAGGDPPAGGGGGTGPGGSVGGTGTAGGRTGTNAVTASGGRMATTGANAGRLGAFGGILLAGGAAMVLSARRRRGGFDGGEGGDDVEAA